MCNTYNIYATCDIYGYYVALVLSLAPLLERAMRTCLCKVNRLSL